MKKSVLKLLDKSAERVYNEYLALYDRGRYHDSIDIELRYELAEFANSPDWNASYNLGLSIARWECGGISDDDFGHIAVFAENGSTVHGELLEIVSTPPSKPRARKNKKKNLAPYGPGIGLSILTDDEKYCAFLVLDAKNDEMNLIAELDYFEDNPPDQSTFEARRWLTLTHHRWQGVRDITWLWTGKRSRPDSRYVTAVCKITLRPDDPKDSNTYSFWSDRPFCQAPAQRRWDAGERDF